MKLKLKVALVVLLAGMLAISIFSITGCGDDDDDDDDRSDDDDDNDDDGSSPFEFIIGADKMDLDNANTFCSDAGYRLPTITELRSMIKGCEGTVTGGECPVGNDCSTKDCAIAACHICKKDEGPASGCYGPDSMAGQCATVWSTSNVSDTDDRYWTVSFTDGHVSHTYMENDAITPLCIK